MADKKDEKDVKDVIKDLDDLHKSKQDEIEDGISALEKALADLEQEELHKGQDNDEDDKCGKDSDAGGDDDKGECKEDGDDKSGDDFGKSLEGEDIFEELVKASEAYGQLTETVAGVGTRVEELAKSQTQTSADLATLAADVASLTKLNKGIGLAIVGLSKSLKELVGQPGKASTALLSGEQHEETVVKSKSEVCNLLKAAIDSGDLESTDARWLSQVSVHGPGVLPESICKIIGL